MNYCPEPIAIVRSPYREKFATPRQPGLTPGVRARIEFLPDFASPEAVRGLAGFSHIWLVFLFHQTLGQGWKPTVRPPRLGGNQRVGVFASRSPFRPNPIGLSAVRLLSIHSDAGRLELEVQGADLIDGTPILDIKPYLPYSDSLPEAESGFAPAAPEAALNVSFNPKAQEQLLALTHEAPGLETLIRETLALDPRPAYKRDSVETQEFGVRLDRYNVRWVIEGGAVIVLGIELVE